MGFSSKTPKVRASPYIDIIWVIGQNKTRQRAYLKAFLLGESPDRFLKVV